MALIFDQEKIAKHLLDCGANFNNASEDGESPFFVALMRNAFSVVETMMMYDIVFEEQMGRHKQSIFHKLFIFGASEDEILKFLELFAKSKNISFDIKNRMSQTPLFYAAHFNYLKVMEFLLEYGCDPFVCDRNINTVLHYCSSGDAVELLLKYFKSSGSPGLVQEYVNKCNNQGNTPMHIAYAFGEPKQIQVLLQNGCILTSKNKNGNIPHHMVMCDRRRLLPFYTTDEEAPRCGCLLIGSLHTVVDTLINF